MSFGPTSLRLPFLHPLVGAACCPGQVTAAPFCHYISLSLLSVGTLVGLGRERMFILGEAW